MIPSVVDTVRQRIEPVVQQPSGLEGTYVVDLADSAENRRTRVGGRWVVTFRPDGVMEITAPDTYPHPRTGQAYRVDGDELRTDALVDSAGCQAAGMFVGTYRWARNDTILRFVLVSDSCPARVALFSGQDWEVVS